MTAIMTVKGSASAGRKRELLLMLRRVYSMTGGVAVDGALFKLALSAGLVARIAAKKSAPRDGSI